MMTRLLEIVVMVALGAAIVMNAVLIVRTRYLAAHPPAQVSLYRAGLAVTPSLPSATFGSNGQRLEDIRSRAEHGWAVRYVSKDCGYCETDVHGKRLISELEELGMPVAILVPRAGEEVADGMFAAASPQMTFVPVGWIKQLRLTVTPTLMIFDGKGALVWHHQGTLQPDDVTEAMSLVMGLKAD